MKNVSKGGSQGGVDAYLCMFSYFFLFNKIEAIGTLCGELEL